MPTYTVAWLPIAFPSFLERLQDHVSRVDILSTSELLYSDKTPEALAFIIFFGLRWLRQKFCLAEEECGPRTHEVTAHVQAEATHGTPCAVAPTAFLYSLCT